MVAVVTECAVFEVHVEAEETVERRECDIKSQDQMALLRHVKLTVGLI
jgi:hypothetical protein